MHAPGGVQKDPGIVGHRGVWAEHVCQRRDPCAGRVGGVARLGQLLRISEEHQVAPGPGHGEHVRKDIWPASSTKRVSTLSTNSGRAHIHAVPARCRARRPLASDTSSGYSSAPHSRGGGFPVWSARWPMRSVGPVPCLSHDLIEQVVNDGVRRRRDAHASPSDECRGSPRQPCASSRCREDLESGGRKCLGRGSFVVRRRRLTPPRDAGANGQSLRRRAGVAKEAQSPHHLRPCANDHSLAEIAQPSASTL